jgi:hypothetical protein
MCCVLDLIDVAAAMALVIPERDLKAALTHVSDLPGTTPEERYVATMLWRFVALFSTETPVICGRSPSNPLIRPCKPTRFAW